MEGDREAVYAYYALHLFGKMPRDFISLDRYEKAFIEASIEIKMENERKLQR